MNHVILSQNVFINYNLDVHVGLIKDLFFYASNDTIKIIDIRKEIKDGEVIEIDVNKD